MKDVDWQKVDLNLLKVLRVLIEEQSTSKAAERLFIGQSAVSKALQKLRVTFGDELFVRDRHGLKPTIFCLSLNSKLNSVFDGLSDLIQPGINFDPSTCEKQINIALNSMLYTAVANKLYSILRKAAPRAKFHFSLWGTDTESKLINGQVDIGINFSPLDISSFIRSIPVVEAEFFICAKKGSTYSELGANHKSMALSPLVLLVMPSYANTKSIAEQYMADLGIAASVLSRSDNLDVCLSILKKEDAGMPIASILRSTVTDEVEFVPFEPGIKLPEHNIAVHTAYANTQNSFNAWLIELASEAIKELEAESRPLLTRL